MPPKWIAARQNNSRRQFAHDLVKSGLALETDAGFWYRIAEIETEVRWKINTVTVMIGVVTDIGTLATVAVS